MKPTISNEEDQFLSELVEKCCKFEANERIEFKSICNLIETQFSKLDQTQQPNKNNDNNVERYMMAPGHKDEEYKTTPAHDYNSMQLQESTPQDQ